MRRLFFVQFPVSCNHRILIIEQIIEPFLAIIFIFRRGDFTTGGVDSQPGLEPVAEIRFVFDRYRSVDRFTTLEVGSRIEMTAPATTA